MMGWWEDTEAKAHRTKSPASLAQTLWQRCQAAGMDSDLSYGPTYDLAHLHDLCVDLVKHVEGLLVLADADTMAVRRQALLLLRWVRYAFAWTQSSLLGFNLLMDSLEFENGRLAEREDIAEPKPVGAPEAQPKLDGRYQHWHLLFERLDLKLAVAVPDERVRRGLSRSLTRVYEQSLLTVRAITQMEKETHPRFRAMAVLLLELNTTWHFDLGPYHLGYGELKARGPSPTGLQTWLFLAFGG
jgi:hypothetical protein